MKNGMAEAVSRAVLRWFARPDMTATELRKRAEWAILCGPLFIIPLLLMHESVPLYVKVLLELCWVCSLFIGYVLYAEHKKRGR